MKFKVGDKVVVDENCVSHFGEGVPDWLECIIVSIDESETWSHKLRYEGGAVIGWKPEFLIPYDVFYSPLYQALL